ncbi:MAG: HAD family phosphatase, partial [Crenarchaeota archaeon]|nr:HAD family phosphatase [Thermoproteota archaeon]
MKKSAKKTHNFSFQVLGFFMFEAVIFDWDGTLADTQEVLLISFRKALESINYTVSDQQIKRRIGIGVIETFKELLNDQGKLYDDKLL